MRHICTRCKLTSEDGNLWCQEVDCPAGTLPMLFNYGDYLGNIKILELLRVLPTTAIYKVERNEEFFFLKVANPGPEAEQYLMKEAENWRTVSQSEFTHPALPLWVHHDAVNGQDPYGMITFRDQLRYYFLLEYHQGDFLNDVLLDNPQPWHEHVGWFMLSLSEAIIRLYQATSHLHLNLNPDVLLVVENNAGIPQPLLLDLGLSQNFNEMLIISTAQDLQTYTLPAYTARELVNGGRLTEAADVYGLGLLLYEMLAGEPAYQYLLRKTEDIHDDVMKIDLKLKRYDLPAQPRGGGQAPEQHFDSLLDVVERSIHRNHPQPYQTVNEFRVALFNLYGPVENKRKLTMGWWGRAALVLGALVIILFVMVMLLLALVDLDNSSAFILPV
jgi:serine/threonine protein kinase